MSETTHARWMRPAQADVAALCRRYHIVRLGLFGSVLRDDFSDDSDVDILVEFESDHVPGFLTLYDVEQTLSHLFGGRRVDVVTPKSLSLRLRSRILESTEVLFAA